MLKSGMKLGSLGGAQTFGDQASRELMSRYPEFAEIVYSQTAEEVVDSVLEGRIAAACIPEQMTNTGFHPRDQSLVVKPGSRLHIIAETTHEYHCSLLGKPGATMSQIKLVIGHTGSVTQSRRWIEKNMPGVAIEIVHTNSRTAAKTVMESDGSIASVGTPGMAGVWGLIALAKDIDEGSVGNYWAISRDPCYSESPTRLVVAGRFIDACEQQGKLSGLICALSACGYVIQTICSQPSGTALFEYDYLIRFRGTGKLADVQAALAPYKSARLVGALEAR